MSEQKHTPGPWEAWRDEEGCWGIIKDNAFLTTAFDPDFGGVEGSAEANARLIAAAPDLLAMLKVAQLWLDVDGRFDMQGINAAIAKAEIRS